MDKISAHTTEVDRGEKVLQVDVENVAAVAVFPCVGDNGFVAFETMGDPILAARGLVDFINTILKQRRKLLLHSLQTVNRRFDGARPTIPFGACQQL
jgi:hypothetical protein